MPRAALWGALVLLGGLPVWACSVPVFRYALEKWKSDNYTVVVFHKGAFTADEQALIDRLAGGGDTASASATESAGQIVLPNVELTTVDLDALDAAPPALRKLWKSQKSAQAPWMVLRYPREMADPWAGPLTAENVDRLVDSPVRREIARRILKGETGVWVFIDGGNKEQDDAAFKFLSGQLVVAGLELKLPDIDQQDIDDGLVTIDPDDLQVAFSAVRVSRADPAETLLVEMLLGSEGGGPESLRSPQYAGQPLAFPIFGRGRVLYGLVGKGINVEMIDEACQELVGPCTCEIKEQNPGVDLVMSVDWDRLVESHIEIDKQLPPLTSPASFASPATDESQNLAAAAPQVETAKRSDPSPASNSTTPAGSATRAAESGANKSAASNDTAADGRSTDGAESHGVLWNSMIFLAIGAIAVVVFSLVTFARRR